jgi:hypothetical protein
MVLDVLEGGSDIRISDENPIQQVLLATVKKRAIGWLTSQNLVINNLGICIAERCNAINLFIREKIFRLPIHKVAD